MMGLAVPAWLSERFLPGGASTHPPKTARWKLKRSPLTGGRFSFCRFWDMVGQQWGASMASIAGTDLVIVYRDPRDLRAYANNARTHSKTQVAQVRASINTFGFTNPILQKGSIPFTDLALKRKAKAA